MRETELAQANQMIDGGSFTPISLSLQKRYKRLRATATAMWVLAGLFVVGACIAGPLFWPASIPLALAASVFLSLGIFFEIATRFAQKAFVTASNIEQAVMNADFHGLSTSKPDWLNDIAPLFTPHTNHVMTQWHQSFANLSFGPHLNRRDEDCQYRVTSSQQRRRD